MTWMKENDVTQEEMLAMKPVIQKYKELYNSKREESRQDTADGRATEQYEYVKGRQKRQTDVLDPRADEQAAYDISQRGKIDPVQQSRLDLLKLQIQNAKNGKQGSTSDLKYQEENAFKDLSSKLKSFGVNFDPEAGSFVIPVDKEGMPDSNILKVIDSSGFNFTTGKRVMTKDKWGSNNEYGLEVNLGSYKGQPSQPAGQGASVPQPAPGGTTPDKRPSAADFLDTTTSPPAGREQTGKPSVGDFVIKPGAVQEPKPSKISNIPKGSIKDLSLTEGKDPYGNKETYAAPESIITKIQKLAGKTQSTGKKFGEGEIEYALRTAGIETDLAKQKEIATKLKKKYPKASEKEIAEFILESTKGIATK